MTLESFFLVNFFEKNGFINNSSKYEFEHDLTPRIDLNMPHLGGGISRDLPIEQWFKSYETLENRLLTRNGQKWPKNAILRPIKNNFPKCLKSAKVLNPALFGKVKRSYRSNFLYLV